MGKEITLTIDGKRVSAPEGTLIVDAAKQIGIDIPVFCYHPKMEPVGMCRVCLVDVGRPVRDRESGELELNADGSTKIQFGWKLETACTVPVSEGMVVEGMTEKPTEARKDILEFLLTSHPLDCPICDKGGECPLQNLTMDFGSSNSRFIVDEKIHLQKKVPLGDLIFLDRERCIQCARCTRFQDEIVDDAVIGFYNRGRKLEIMTSSKPGFDSYWSGNTTDICPVGALTTVDFHFSARPWELNKAASICGHCPVGCNTTINTRREAKSDGKVVIKRIMPRQNEQVNEIWLCDKGRFTHHYVNDSERLTEPLIRKNGELVPVKWEEALNLVSQKLFVANENVASLVTGRLANEDLFNMGALITNLGGTNLLYTSVGGGDLVPYYGLDENVNLGEIGPETCIIVAASDLEEEAPLWWLRIKQATERGAKLIVINNRPTRLTKYAEHNIYTFGLGTIDFLEVLVEENEDLKTIISEAENLIIFTGADGIGIHASSELVKSGARLLDMLEKTGNPGSGLVLVHPRANDQGAWDMGYRPINNKSLSNLQTLLIAGADPVGDDANFRTMLDQIDFVAVQELFLTETAKVADVVLPVQAFAEREGSYTSGERRVQRFYPAVPAKHGVLPDYKIAAFLACRLDQPELAEYPSLIMENVAKEVPAYTNVNYLTISAIEEQRPMMGREDLYYGGTSYANNQGLGTKLPVLEKTEQIEQAVNSFEVSKEEIPDNALYLLPVSQLYDHGTLILKSSILSPRIPEMKEGGNIVFGNLPGKKHGELIRIPVEMNGSSIELKIRQDSTLPKRNVLIPRSLGFPLSEQTIIQFDAVEEEG